VDHTKPWLRYVATSSLDDETLDLDDMKVRNDQGEELGTVDGFVVDSVSGRPRYIVVDAGGWFTAKQFLVPIGEVHLEPARDALRVPLAKEQIRRFPGFDLDEFQPLTAEDIDRLNTQHDVTSQRTDTATPGSAWTNASFEVPEWWGRRKGQPGRSEAEAQARRD
jgi:hypothetical protein